MKIGRNGSSACSATAITARMTVSDRGMTPVLAPESRRVPTSTTALTSLATCSFSTACLLSRSKDLENQFNNVEYLNGITHLTIYQSNASPKQLTLSLSTNVCRISLYPAARHCFEHVSPRQGKILKIHR